MMNMEAHSGNGSVPIAAVSLYCSGEGFLSKFYDFVEITETAGALYIDLNQFKEILKLFQNGASRSELKNVAKKSKNPSSYSKDGITIVHVVSCGRKSRKWYYRRQIEGHRIMFPLEQTRYKSHEKAREIKNAIKAAKKAGPPLLTILKTYHSKSTLIRKLESENKVRHTPPSARENTESFAIKPSRELTIQQLVDAYLEQSKNPVSRYKPSTARENVNQLRKVVQLGTGAKFPENTKPDAIKKELFKHPVSSLSAKIVDRFQEVMLVGDSEDYEDVDELKRLKRSNSANSTLKQAKSVFSAKAKAAYRRAGLELAMPSEFLQTTLLSVADAHYTLPEFTKIKALFSVLPEMRKTNPDRYLVLMLGLFSTLRPQETKWLRKEMIQDSGYSKIRIEVTKDFVPKQYEVRRFKIPPALGRHLLEVARDNGSNFVLSGHKTQRTVYLFRATNQYLRKHFLPGVNRPCYELRKISASACSVALGMDITHRRMGHKERSTTEKHYVDRDTPRELVDLFDAWAEKLFGGPSFEK